MSIQSRVYQAMKPDCIYRPCDLAVELQMDSGGVAKILKMFSKGGLVEEIRTDEYRRKRMYKTRQAQLL